MFLLYDIIFTFFMVGYLPFFFVKLGQAEDKKRLLLDRLSFYASSVGENSKEKKVIWIHAVSVGETLAARDFLRKMHSTFPDYRIILSTVTATGNRVAKKIADDNTDVIYFPLDISGITNKAVRYLHPSIVILMETELWPNLILSAHTYGAKIVIINGRLSPQSFRSYYRVKGLLQSVFKKIDLYLMQTDRYAKRLKKIGIPEHKIVVTGNMKFDNVEMPRDVSVDPVTLKAHCGFQSNDIIVIAASTHRGEETIMCDVYRKLRTVWPQCKMLIAPRHIERTQEIIEILNRYRFSYAVADNTNVSEKMVSYRTDGAHDVYILNTIGELKKMYAIGDVVFMGGSFIKHGGQNPLEAVVYKKAIVSGPHVFNFSDMYQTLFTLGAAVKVDSPEMCLRAIETILKDKTRTLAMTTKAYTWIEEMKGASERNSQYIKQLLGKT